MFSEGDVTASHEATLEQARRALAALPFAADAVPEFRGLRGWVFEQTVRHCLRQELVARGLDPPIREQWRIAGTRKVADLLVERVAVEVKESGLFAYASVAKYRDCQAHTTAAGFHYLYRAGVKTNPRLRAGMRDAVGAESAFYLDHAGDWRRFVDRLVCLLTVCDTDESTSRS